MTREIVDSARDVTEKQLVQVLREKCYDDAQYGDPDHCADSPNPEEVEQRLQNRTATASCGFTHRGHNRDYEPDSESLEPRADQSEHEHDRYPNL